MSHSSSFQRATLRTKHGRFAFAATLLMLALAAQPSAQASQVTGTGISSVITRTPPPRASKKAAPKAGKTANGTASAQSKRSAGAKS